MPKPTAVPDQTTEPETPETPPASEERTVEVKVDGKDETVERKLLNVVIRGGPLSRGPDFTLEVDGVPMKHGTKAMLVLDVNDAIRLQTEQILVFADIEVRVASWKKLAVADVRLRTQEDADMVKVEGRGDTALDALKDAVRQLEHQA